MIPLSVADGWNFVKTSRLSVRFVGFRIRSGSLCRRRIRLNAQRESLRLKLGA